MFLFRETPLPYFTPFRGISGIVRRIGDADNQWALAGSDEEFARNLLRKDGTVG